MNLIKSNLFILVYFFSINTSSFYYYFTRQKIVFEWIPAELLSSENKYISMVGKPKIVDCKYGQALSFNGESDGLFSDEMPLAGFSEFTVEMIFYPETNSPFEQRILHIGEVKGDRMLLEIRAVNNNWYFDGFVASKTNKKTLISEELTHPLGKWYHVALVVGPDNLTTFVNGKQELSESFSFKSIESGRSSIGVRQNKQSWFKGMIYKIRITPKQLNPDEFIKE